MTRSLHKDRQIIVCGSSDEQRMKPLEMEACKFLYPPLLLRRKTLEHGIRCTKAIPTIRLLTRSGSLTRPRGLRVLALESLSDEGGVVSYRVVSPDAGYWPKRTNLPLMGSKLAPLLIVPWWCRLWHFGGGAGMICSNKGFLPAIIVGNRRTAERVQGEANVLPA